MPKLSILNGRGLYSAAGKRLGHVRHVLFHPTEPKVVGFEVDRSRLFGLVPRKPRFVPRESLSVSEGALVFEGKRLPAAAAGEKERGWSWDETVIWMGMPVRTEDGQSYGAVGDAEVSIKSGAVRSLTVSGGITSDVAVGRVEFPGDAVLRFDGERLLIATPGDDVGYSGGMAAVAGKGAAVAKVRTEQALKKAGKYGSAAAKAAFGEDPARRAGAAAAGAWRSVKKMVRETMEDEDE